MAVVDQVPKVSSVANGLTAYFPFDFQVPTIDDLVVTVDGVVQTGGFTVTGLGTGSGGVFFATNPTNGALVDIERSTRLERKTDYQQHGDFRSTIVNADFDRPILALQEVKAKVDSIQVGAVTEAGITDALGYRPTSVDDVNLLIANLPGAATQFLQGGAGAIVRTVQDKQRDLVHAKDFGVVGDGTTDDTAAWLIAMNDAAVLGARLDISGLNVLTDPFQVPTNLRSIEGATFRNSRITFRAGSYATSARMIDQRGNTEEFVLRKVTIAVDGTSFDHTWTADLTGSNGSTWEDFRVIGSGDSGVTFLGGSDITVRRFRFDATNGGFHCAVYGNSTAGDAHRYHVEKGKFYGGFDYGVQLGGDGVHASDNHHIDDPKGFFTPGRTVFGFSLAGCAYSHIRRPYAENTLHEAFQMSDCFFCTITGWTAKWDGTNGIDFATSIEGSGVGGASSQHCKIGRGFAVNAFSAIAAIANNSRNCIIEDVQGKDCGVRDEAANPGYGCVIAIYTDVAGVSCGGHVTKGVKHVNEAGPVHNFYLEVTNSGSPVAGNTVIGNVFNGVTNGLPYVVVDPSTIIDVSGSAPHPMYDETTLTTRANRLIRGSDSGSHSGVEHSQFSVVSQPVGAGDAAVNSTDIGFSLSAVKQNWFTTSVAGQIVALNIASRGGVQGHDNVDGAGDMGNIIINSVNASKNHSISAIEATIYSTDGGAGTNLFNVAFQAAIIEPKLGIAEGVVLTAQSGGCGNAVNIGNSRGATGGDGTWTNALRYVWNDGTHAAYEAFKIMQAGWLYMAEPDGKSFTVRVSDGGYFEWLVNGAVVASISPAGVFTGGGAAAATWTVYAPSIAPFSGAYSSATVAGSGAGASYSQNGKVVNLQLDIAIANVGTGSGPCLISLPVPATSTGYYGGAISGIDIGSGRGVTGFILGSTLQLSFADGTTNFANGARLVLSGTYRAA